MYDDQLFHKAIARLHAIANGDRKDLTQEHQSVFPCLEHIDEWKPRTCQHFKRSMIALEKMDPYHCLPQMQDHMAIGLLGIYSQADPDLPQEDILLLADFLSDYSYDRYQELLSFFGDHDLLEVVKEKSRSDFGDATTVLGEIEKYYLRHDPLGDAENELRKRLFHLKTYHQMEEPEEGKEQFYHRRLLDSLREIPQDEFAKWINDLIEKDLTEGENAL